MRFYHGGIAVRVDLDRYLEDRLHDGITSCITVALSDDERTRYAGWKGDTDSREGGGTLLVGPETRFNVGSVTKPITASLVCKLIELGEITFSDSVRRIIPEYPFHDVCISHLMTHSAGYDEHRQPAQPTRQQGIEGYLRELYAIRDKSTAAGVRSGYFTAGYAILMDIIQRVADTDIESFARQILFDPLGMTRTTYDTTTLNEADRVYPVTVEGHRSLELKEMAITADSGLYATAEDLVKFGRLFLNEGTADDGRSVFLPSTTAFMMSPYMSGSYDYTPVFWYKKSIERTGNFADTHAIGTVGHSGFSGCMLWIDPTYRRTGAIVTNSVKVHTTRGYYSLINNALMGSGL